MRTAYAQQQHGVDSPARVSAPSVSSSKIRRSEVTRVLEAVKSVALCHNVTPTYEGGDRPGGSSDDTEADQHSNQQVVYQASSPDEVFKYRIIIVLQVPSSVVLSSMFQLFQVALVKWTEKAGLALVHRDLVSMQLRNPTGSVLSYTILQIFPFTSETKRMGIIVKVNILNISVKLYF